MDVLRPEVLAAIAAAVVVLFLLLGRRRQPPERSYRCGRCAKLAEHTPRTADAWRAGKTKFFCSACHAQWLRVQPAAARRGHGNSPPRGGKAGCLGVLAFVALVPALLGATWWAYA